MTVDPPDVRGLHARVPGVTEDLLRVAQDTAGRDPYRWLAELIPSAGPVLDLCCGSAALADCLDPARYLGVDSSPDELAVAAARRPHVRTRLGEALDPPGDAAATITVSMGLMLLPLEGLLARVRGTLPAGGVLAGTVPLRSPALDGTPYNRLLATLGWRGEPFPEPLHDLAGRAASCGFELSSDELSHFAVPVERPAQRELLLRSFYLPVVDLGGARRLLLGLAEAGTTLPYPIRRIALRRGADPAR